MRKYVAETIGTVALVIAGTGGRCSVRLPDSTDCETKNVA